MKPESMNSRERLLRTIKFDNPDFLSASFYWDGEWVKYHTAEEIVAVTSQLESDQAHYIFYHPYDDRPIDEKRRIDAWGCIWQYEIEGIHGQAVGNPIDDYGKLSTYRPPFHVLEKDRSELERFIENTRDKVRSLGWMQLYERMRYLRPAQELYIDIGLDDPGVYKLRDLVAEFLHRELDIYLDYDVDMLTFSEDWGTQTSLQISPAAWRRIFKPTYKELFDRIHKAGKMVEFHSCGYIREIIPDLVELGVEVLHCQAPIMDMDELFGSFAGKICFKADFNRQKLPFESPEWVYNEVHRIYNALGRNQPGGLYLFAEVAGATPIENMQAFVDAVKDIRREQTGQ